LITVKRFNGSIHSEAKY